MNWSVDAGLAGKGVMVTGAAGGIGRAVAHAFASSGARVMAVDLEKEGLDRLVADLPGSDHFGLAADLTNLDFHRDLVAAAADRLGSLFALAHLAAVLRRRSDIDEISEEDWNAQIDLNLKASFFLAREAANSMVSDGSGGRIVFFTSQAWWSGGFGGSIVYAASKGGLTSLSRGLARTFGPHGITVNCVAPGQVNTHMLTEGLSESLKLELERQTPLGYIAEPKDIVGAVLFLASEHARYITGTTLNVSGGLLMY